MHGESVMSEPAQQPLPANGDPTSATPNPVPNDAAPSETPPAAEKAPPKVTLPPQDKPGDKAKKKPGGGGQGGMSRVRFRPGIPELKEDFQFGTRANVADLDKEIADELENALTGFDKTQLAGADTSRQVRDKNAVAGDQGKKKGKVISIHGADIFIDVPGGRCQGVLQMMQFPEGAPKLGDEVEVSIEGYDPANGLLILSRRGSAVQADWSSVTEGMIVEARVLETNKGGLTVDVNGIRGFLPISQIDLYRVENAEQFINQKLICMVTEANKEERNLVLSRRALLEKERAEQSEKTWAALDVNQIREGIVRKVLDFGAFVDLGGVDGLLPISEMSWRRNIDPNTIVQPGQTIRVSVLRIDREAKRITLGLKQLEESPWTDIQNKYPVGSMVNGKVSRTMDFGAFVELEPAVEGLIHVSELARNKVWRVTDVAKPGQEVTVKVLSVDPEARRISLSLRQAIEALAPKPKTEEEQAAEEEAAAPAEPAKPPRQQTTPLRGGTGGGGPLFQLPGDNK